MNFMTEILMIKADSTDTSGHIINQLTQYNSMFSDSWLPDNIFLYVSLRLSRLAFWPILKTPGMIDITSTTLGSYAEKQSLRKWKILRLFECLRRLQYLLQVANTSETPPELWSST